MTNLETCLLIITIGATGNAIWAWWDLRRENAEHRRTLDYWQLTIDHNDDLRERNRALSERVAWQESVIDALQKPEAPAKESAQ